MNILKNLYSNYIYKSILWGALLFYSSQTFASSASIAIEDSIPTTTKDTLRIGDESVFIIEDTKALDTTALPSIEYSDSVIIKHRKHSPRTATLLSMALPGAGQVYNKQYWKVPIIYGAGVTIYYFWDTYNGYYHRFKTAHEMKVQGRFDEVEEEFKDDVLWDEERLSLNRDHFRRLRDYQIIFFGLTYFANIVDAMVDAHLLYYDVSDDLTMQIQPGITPVYNPGNNNFGVGGGLTLSFRFK